MDLSNSDNSIKGTITKVTIFIEKSAWTDNKMQYLLYVFFNQEAIKCEKKIEYKSIEELMKQAMLLIKKMEQ